MKKLFILLVMFLPFCMKAQNVKIAYVNIAEIMTAMPEVATMNKQLETFQSSIEKELATMNEEFNKKYQDYVAARDSLTENIRLKKEADLQDLQTRTQNYMVQARQDIEKKQQELSAPIQEKVRNAIKAVGDEKGYTYIITPEVLLYVSPNAENATAAVKSKLGI